MWHSARSLPTATANAHAPGVAGHTSLRVRWSIQANPLDRRESTHALFAASFVRSLAHCGVVLLLGLLACACGQDAEKRYAGLSVAQVQLPSGHGYRVRYLAPPWERISSDPLVTGKNLLVPFGSSEICGAGNDGCRMAVAGSGVVLEIDKQSPTLESGTITYPKYRLEAAFLRCDAAELPLADECADYLAREDVLGRRDAEAGDDLIIKQESGSNDWGQSFRDILTQSKESLRYRRIVYFVTSDRLLALRLLLEANPSLAEREVTRMVQATQLFDTQPAEGDGVGDDAGSPP
jgi:hypothetical protein